MNGTLKKNRNDTLSELYAEPEESFLRRYGKRIAGGLACAAVVSFIMHLPYIKLMILWCCQIVIFIFGRPPGYDKLPEVRKKAGQAIVKVKQIAHTHKDRPTPVAALDVGAKLKEEVHAVKETAAKIKTVEQNAEKGAEKLAHAGHDIANVVKDTGTKAKDAVDGAAARVAKALHDRKEAKEHAAYDRLVVRARVAGVKVDASWSLTRLDAEVNLAEDIAWRKRYNAQCPNPRCRAPARVTRHDKQERFICLRCKTNYSGGTALAAGPPIRPRRNP
jgi:Sec-independent protein translocase protein TatA